MAPLCYRRHRFPPAIIQHAIWLYLRVTLSYRDVEELLAERGLDISYETVRGWVLKFGPSIARRLRRQRPRPSDLWHLDEMVVRIAGERMYLTSSPDFNHLPHLTETTARPFAPHPRHRTRV
jgi:putative transposase